MVFLRRLSCRDELYLFAVKCTGFSSFSSCPTVANVTEDLELCGSRAAHNDLVSQRRYLPHNFHAKNLLGSDPTSVVIPAYTLGFPGSTYHFQASVASELSSQSSSVYIQVRERLWTGVYDHGENISAGFSCCSTAIVDARVLRWESTTTNGYIKE